MRRLFVGAILGLLLSPLVGCDGGNAAKPGVPQGVDFNKAYPPAAQPFSTEDFAKQAADAKKAAPKDAATPGG